MTYDQWKTTDPSDCAPVCDACGGYLRGFLGSYICDDCEDELWAEEEMVRFYCWEPESQSEGRDGCVARHRASHILPPHNGKATAQ